MSIRILDRLQDEWEHITVRASELHAVRTWSLPGPPPSSLDDVLASAGYRQPPSVLPGGRTPRPNAHLRRIAFDQATADAYLLRLVDIAAEQPLATRVVLQRILPALSAVARRHGGDRRHEVIDELVANSWSVIRAYPVARRPRRVAVNLVRDITFETMVRPTRRRAVTAEIPMDFDPLASDDRSDDREPMDELLELVREARLAGRIDDGDIALIGDLLRLRRPLDVAAAREVTPRTVRNHRDAVVYRLRSHIAAA